MTGLLEAALEKGRASGLLTLPPERGGRTLEASAVRVAPERQAGPAGGGRDPPRDAVSAALVAGNARTGRAADAADNLRGPEESA